MADPRYVPGVCNIGAKEAARRRLMGHIGLFATIVLFLILYSTHVNPWWRAFIFFPATMAAAGYLQAKNRFCFGYAAQGVYNFGTPGKTTQVADDASKRKDRRHGNQLFLYSLVIGAAAAALSIAIG